MGGRLLNAGSAARLLAGAILMTSGQGSKAEEFRPIREGLPAYVAKLEFAFGVPNRNGFGSAVFFASASDSAALEARALQAARYFLGATWDRWGADTWTNNWRVVYRRHAERDIVRELHALADPGARSSADLLLYGSSDPAAAREALKGAFDDPAVDDLTVFNLGDGAALSGVVVAARRKTDEAVLLALLMD